MGKRHVPPGLVLLAPLVLAGCAITAGPSEGTLFGDRRARVSSRAVPPSAGHAAPPRERSRGVTVASAPGVAVRFASGGTALPLVTGELDLLGAVNTALARNLDLRSAFLKRDEARGAIVSARAAAFPDVGLGAAAERDFSGPGGTPDSRSLTASVVQPLWRSGAVSAGLRYAGVRAECIDEAIRQKAQETIASVARDFYSALLARQMVRVYEESRDVAERMLDTARKKRRAGTASDYEVIRAEVEVASSRAALIKEQNALETVRVALLQRMGVRQDSDVTLSGELSYREEINDPGALVSLAMLHRPDLLRADAAVRLAAEDVRLARSAFGPSADLLVNWRAADPDPNDREGHGPGDDWSAGVRLSFTLFDGMDRRGKVMQAESRLRQAEADLRSAEETARVEIVRALLDVRNAAELYRSQEKNIGLAREALRMIENGNRVGKNTQIEVLDARSALTGAIGQYYKAIHAHVLARLAVREAAGTLGFDATERVVPGSRLGRDPLAVRDAAEDGSGGTRPGGLSR